MVPGEKEDFDLTELLAGEEKKVELKKNMKELEFGLCEATGGGGGVVQNETGNMEKGFVARQMADVKVIKVGISNGIYKAFIVLNDNNEHELYPKMRKNRMLNWLLTLT